MSAPDLDDAVEVLRFFRQRGAQFFQRRQQAVGDGVHRRHMHGRREHVIGRLAAVDLVVGVHQARLASLAAQQFAGAVGQHLVDVHVGLRAGAGLPDDQGELAAVLPGNHFIGCGDDGVRLLLIQQPQPVVHHG
jgi:hypothetical protein